MRLVTKNEIKNFNLPDTFFDRLTSKVIGRLIPPYTANSFNYIYETVDGVFLRSKKKDIPEDKVDELYDLIKNDIPEGLTKTQSTEYEYYLGFRIEMAKTFKISPTDIEIDLEIPVIEPENIIDQTNNPVL